MPFSIPAESEGDLFSSVLPTQTTACSVESSVASSDCTSEDLYSDVTSVHSGMSPTVVVIHNYENSLHMIIDLTTLSHKSVHWKIDLTALEKINTYPPFQDW